VWSDHEFGYADGAQGDHDCGDEEDSERHELNVGGAFGSVKHRRGDLQLCAGGNGSFSLVISQLTGGQASVEGESALTLTLSPPRGGLGDSEDLSSLTGLAVISCECPHR
jgi:hypothetical protein